MARLGLADYDNFEHLKGRLLCPRIVRRLHNVNAGLTLYCLLRRFAMACILSTRLSVDAAESSAPFLDSDLLVGRILIAITIADQVIYLWRDELALRKTRLLRFTHFRDIPV